MGAGWWGLRSLDCKNFFLVFFYFSSSPSARVRLISISIRRLFVCVFACPALLSMGIRGCQFDDCVFRGGLGFENLKSQVEEMCNMRLIFFVSTSKLQIYVAGMS